MDLLESTDGAAGQRLARPERPPRIFQWLFGQFGQPRGILGSMAGNLMARDNQTNAWVVQLMAIRPDDHVLEVGFGPGLAVALLAEKVVSGRVEGVDISDVMLRQANRRNQARVAAGQVNLRLGSVDALPYPDGHFSRACAIHSIYFWPSLAGALKELHRVLVADGLLALAVRMRRGEAGVFDPSRYGLTDVEVGTIIAGLQTAGFRDVASSVRDLDRETVMVLLARS